MGRKAKGQLVNMKVKPEIFALVCSGTTDIIYQLPGFTLDVERFWNIDTHSVLHAFQCLY